MESWRSGLINDSTKRVRPDRLRGVLRLGDRDSLMDVVDASVTGMAVVLALEVPPGDRVFVELRTQYGLIDFFAEARYCVPYEGQPGLFRVGVMLETPPDDVASRWKLVLADAAQQKKAA